MNCLYCGKPLKISFARPKKYCNKKCRVNYNYEKKKKIDEENKKNKGPLYCECCGKLLTGRQRKYCSLECKNGYNNGSYKNPFPEIKAQKPKKSGKPKMSLSEVIALAKKEGLTYGKYCEKHNLY